MKTGKKIAVIILIIGIVLVIVGAILFIAGIGRSDWDTTSVNKTFDEEIKKFDITCDIGDLIIKYSPDVTKTEIKCDNIIENNLDISSEGSKLVIDYEAEKWHKYISLGTLNDNISSGKIYITLPTNEIEELVVNAGIGETKINGLNVKNSEINAGIGEFTINKCSFDNKINIKTGIGEFNINHCVLNDVSFDAGIGDSNFKNCDLTGICIIKNGIGEIDMSLTRSKDYYSFDVDNGIGTIDIDGQLVLTDEVSGKTIITLENGIGDINIECAS